MAVFRNETFLLGMIMQVWITCRGDRLWAIHLSLKQDKLDLRAFDELVIWLRAQNAEVYHSKGERYRDMYDTVCVDGNQWSAFIEHVNDEDMLLDGDDLTLLTPHYYVQLQLGEFESPSFVNVLTSEHQFSLSPSVR